MACPSIRKSLWHAHLFVVVIAASIISEEPNPIFDFERGTLNTEKEKGFCVCGRVKNWRRKSIWVCQWLLKRVQSWVTINMHGTSADSYIGGGETCSYWWVSGKPPSASRGLPLRARAPWECCKTAGKASGYSSTIWYLKPLLYHLRH